MSNNKILLLLLTLTVLIGMASISAADINDTSISADDSAISDASSISSDDVATTNDNDNDNLKTESKTVKTDSKTVKSSGNTYNVDETNYGNYIDSNGGLTDNVTSGDTLNFNGNFSNKNIAINDKSVTLTSTGSNAIFHNSTITAAGSSSNANEITIGNLVFADSTTSAITISQGYSAIIENNTITINSNSDAYGIKLTEADNSIIKNNTMTIDAVPSGITYYNDANYNYEGQVSTFGIGVFSSSGVNVSDNTITLTGAANTLDAYNSLTGIAVQGSILNGGKTVSNNKINNNKVYIKGDAYTYGITLHYNAINTTIYNNTITTTSGDGSYVAGIDVTNNIVNTNIIKNTITINATTYAYGIMASGTPYDNVTNTNITQNTITANAGKSRAIELYFVNNAVVDRNIINVNGTYASGIGAGALTNSQITNNTIITTGTTTEAYNSTYDYDNIKFITNGIQMVGCQYWSIENVTFESENNNIQYNQILTNGLKAVNVTGNYNNITDNGLRATMLNTTNITDDSAVTKTDTNNTVSNNYDYTDITVTNSINDDDNLVFLVSNKNLKTLETANPTIKTNVDEFFVGQTIKFKLSLRTESGDRIGGETIYLFINGNLSSTLSGIPSFVDLQRSYTPTESGKLNATLVYNGSDTYAAKNTTLILDVKNMVYDTTITPSTTNAVSLAQKNVNLNATLTRSDNTVVSGQDVTFIINDTENLTAQTNSNGVATVTYTPTTVGIYNVIIKFSGTETYNPSNTTMLLTIYQTMTKLTTVDITTTEKQEVNITATLTSDENTPISGQEIIFILNETVNQTATTGSDGVATISYMPDTCEYKRINMSYLGVDYQYTSSNNTMLLTAKPTTPQTHVITQENYQDYFIKDQGLSDLVFDGDVLDIQGSIISSYDVYIDKAVNITSTTDDGVFNTILSDTPNRQGFYDIVSGGILFEITSTGSYTNVSNVVFNTTRFYTSGAEHININNISVTSYAGIGSGQGTTSFRDGSGYINITNSYFLTNNNGGVSNVVLGGCHHFNITNSTIQGVRIVGNLFYLTTYNTGEGTENGYARVVNCTIIGPETPRAICWAIVLGGSNNYFEGNTVNYTGVGITLQYGGTVGTQNNTFINNTFIGTTMSCPNCTFINNTAPSIYSDGSSVATGNIADSLTIKNNKNETVIVSNNKVNSLSINVDNSIVENNTISSDSLTVNGNNNTIIYNNITSEDDYAVILNGANNTVTKNFLTSSKYVGDEAASGSANNYVYSNNNPLDTTITISPIGQIKVNDTVTLNTTITAENGAVFNDGTVSYYLYDTLLDTASVADGKSSLSYKFNCPADTYNIIAVFNPTDTTTYAQATTSTSLNIRKLNTVITISNITESYGNSITLKAILKDENGNLINGGKVAFKLNGKTLKDANGNVIYVQVANGEAQITIDGIYSAKGYTISATYSGNSIYSSQRANDGILTITNKNPTAMTVTPSTYTPTQGETITVTVEVNDGSTKINTGKVVLKLNGVSLRDSNNNVIYGYVKNGKAQITVKIPASMKSKIYNLTAVYNGKNYSRQEASANVTIIAKP